MRSAHMGKPTFFGVAKNLNYRLLGIVSGYLFETADFQLQVATTLSGKTNANSGISLVVPIDELKNLLDSPALKLQRDAEVLQVHR